ncbi:eukaryotic translation elongation factor 1 epsilon-1 [Chrysoperla carnea]|uniref:eukaryotic translation elongation factor 1 epsilon-1 n=1 Tax=Chrysoperla carnea TaxID=189513 RepID=UPI001D07C15E|nr:eukaryotic translation elongation factor 1 epsilon-1 [Chrysoperla carnea]
MAAELEYAKKVLKLLKVPIGKLSLNKNNTVVQTSGTESIVGLVSIILSALRQTNTLYKYENPIEYLEIEQWIDYSNTTLKQNVSLIKNILPELNIILEARTYIVSTRLTIGDIILYYALNSVMKNLNPYEKAQYLNVSRWFDNIQQDISIRQDLQLINFNTNYLLSTAVLSH